MCACHLRHPSIQRAWFSARHGELDAPSLRTSPAQPWHRDGDVYKQVTNWPKGLEEKISSANARGVDEEIPMAAAPQITFQAQSSTSVTVKNTLIGGELVFTATICYARLSPLGSALRMG